MKFSQMAVQLISLVLILISTRTRGLKMMLLSVPHTADIDDPVTLKCEYDLEGRKLYSVKWYKDENEFFRYMPDYDPQVQAFHTPGITLDLQKSGSTNVTLINLQFNTSGTYRCEVSTEAPNFETVAQNSNMTVMAFPSEDPMIEGVLSAYSVGDIVSANCTSGKSNPTANLSWHINGVKVDKGVWEYREGADETDTQGLHTKTLGLQFQVQNTHFASNGGDIPKMEIRCISTVGEKTRQKAMFPVHTKTLASKKLAQERLRNCAGLWVKSSLNIVFVLITSFHTFSSS